MEELDQSLVGTVGLVTVPITASRACRRGDPCRPGRHRDIRRLGDEPIDKHVLASW